VDPPQAPATLPRLRLSRGLDLLAVAVVLFVLYRLFIQPRLFAAPSAPAVPFVLPALDRAEFRFPAHPGRVVFLDFWASWCEPCKASLPLVEHYAREHPDVEVIPVDSNEPAPEGARFARENGLRAVVLDTQGRVTEAYGIDGLPTVIVIDPRGFIRARWPGFNPAIEVAMENARASFSATPAPTTTP
jgi:thiol-disulfide isomerase/thioredoxin